MTKKSRNIAFFVFMAVFLFLTLLNFGIHVVRTIKFNQTERILDSSDEQDGCSFDLHFRGGTSDSWLKRDVLVDNQICTLKGSTFDGTFKNESSWLISDWSLIININEKCYLNNSWCGTVEVHQKGKIQTLDLRDLKKDVITLDYCYIGQDFMIPLDKGDFVVYHPSFESDEVPIRGFNGTPGIISVGFIFYTDVSDDFDLSDCSVHYNFKKSYFRGTEPMIFMILLTVWIAIILARIIFAIAYKTAENAAERKLNLQRIEDMKNYNEKLNAEVEAKTAHIKEIQQKVVIGLANVIGNRDPDTGGHVNRTSDVIKIVVEEFRKQNPGVLSDEKANDICRAAPMHDLGKIYIESSILCKPGRLTDDEFVKMKEHAQNSGEIVKLILKDVEEPHFVETAFNVARHHHERWDGKGYPDKLSEENIPLEARLMAIADVYDALVSKRCYKQSMSFDKAFDIMCEGMGTQFDPQMKSVFIACRKKLESYYTVNNR